MKFIRMFMTALFVVILLGVFMSTTINTSFWQQESVVSTIYEKPTVENKEKQYEDKLIDEDNSENSGIDHIDNDLNEEINSTEFIPIFTYEDLPREIINKIHDASWKEEAPIGLEDLSYLTVTYWDFYEEQQHGELIVHRRVAEEVVEIFEELYEVRFPIAKMRLVDEYDADDELSMEDNNTYAFCYRVIAGTQRISKHGYGLAIDINPIQNPYVRGETIIPSAGREYIDRINIRKGMITKGDLCYHAFTSRGWTWGGDWKTPKDYHHFEKVID
ncbi:D-alanyl-D-alanine carboxypeptidase [Natronincola peptidivorans]|uniref:D-alanyl-D-alanine carboxypeptidase n=1 Tax=Natronincola peptidivorans TaxID=426128 RepID=A0A1I0A410_9FIRM|nr:M15 family metallopeptidase [Natronincola peptidivorans]SES88708.1 D-alanyl-D-alanine carboxypeptidase [Natronincola peptidivorans]